MLALTELTFFKEIKNRSLLFIVAWLSNTFVFAANKENLLFIFLSSLKLQTLSSNQTYFIFTDLPEIFTVYILLTLFATDQILRLYAFYLITKFITPALKYSQIDVIKQTFTCVCLGWWFTFTVFFMFLLPQAANFFLGLSEKNNNVSPYKFFFEADLLSFLIFYLEMYSVCLESLVFLVPLFVYFNLQKFSAEGTNVKRKGAYIIFSIVSAVFTPPDFLSQLVFFAVLLFFFEAFILKTAANHAGI